MKLNSQQKYFYPLLENGFSNKDISEGVKVLRSKFLLLWANIHRNLRNILQKNLGPSMQ